MSKKICIFTSAATNYLPKAVLLAESVKRFHPEVDVIYGLCDELDSSVDYMRGVFDEVVTADSLNIPNFRSWRFRYGIVELSTAIKPFILKKLLGRGYDAVIYIDPDIVLFSDLNEIILATLNATMTLTPHQTFPENGKREIIANEICSLQHGVYNLGYIGVSSSIEGINFANWWSERCYDWCVAEIERGLFTDQKWIDLAPALFDGVNIVRSSRFNVAPWNLTQRKLSGSVDEGLYVDGLPLAFYHFTGFDSGAHRRMASLNSDGNRSVMDLVDWYDAKTAFLPNDPASKVRWAYDRFDDGSSILPMHRKIYRDRPDLQENFPDPLSSSGYCYTDWLRKYGVVEYPGYVLS